MLTAQERVVAITITYSWQFIQNLDLDFVTSNADVTSLANGGFAGLGNHTSHIDGTIFDASAARTDGWTSTQGTNGALDQLSNGNIVIASQDADSTTLFKIVDSVTGNEVVATVDLADADQSEVDVAALAGGGFWIVATDEIGAPGGDADIDVFRRNNDGSSAGFFTIDSSVARDTGASIASLDGGGVAVAWTRTVGAETEVWYAVYDAAGGVIKAVGQLDTIGTINRNVSVTAMNGGGFAIAYEDNGWDGDVDITLARFNAAGTFIDWDNVSSFAAADENPYVTRMSNGMLAVAYGNNSFADTDTYVTLINPNTGDVLATRTVTGGESISDDTDFAAIAGFGEGRLAVFHTNLTDSDVDGEDLQAVRTVNGDGANDVFFGDELVDILNGNGGADNLAGGANDDTVNGGDDNDILRGNGGDDVLDGGAGDDSMAGGDGDDAYVVSGAGDTLLELLNQGIDEVRAGFDFTLAAHFENLLLTGGGAIDGTGNAAKNKITGNGAANTLSGLDDNDTLIGGGGNDILLGGNGADDLDGEAGADSMAGGAGNDTYHVNTNADATLEAPGAGTDFVVATITHTLRVNVDHLTLAAGAGNINGSGNALFNEIVGNEGSNILNGFDGADIMRGNDGNDTYYVSEAGDVVSETGTGIDIVRTAVTRTLDANVEKMYLLTGAVNGTGNPLSNFIYGNAANNIIDGGAGADRLYGDKGNDTYIVDSAGDLIFETTAGAAGGTDTVQSSVNHTLATNVERLTLTSGGNINATGNTLVNLMIGNTGNNFIDGKLGSDNLTGGLGMDNFVFTTALSAANVDTITDFTVVDDTLRLDNGVFAALPLGFLAAAAFHIGAGAADASDRIIYNAATGAIYYDPDGLGGAVQIRFANLDAGLALTNADVFVF
ncbi:MAG: beta strand repeat-containing protein [Aestuariivirga sp.]